VYVGVEILLNPTPPKLYGGRSPHQYYNIMPTAKTKTPAFNYSLFKNNIDSNTEVLVEITDENIGQVLKKDKILACLCEALDVIPTFSTFTSNKGKEFIVVSNATINELATTLQ